MELLSAKEINTVMFSYGSKKVLDWSVENYSKEVIGYLGEHLRLRIKVVKDNNESELKLFIKCMPRFEKWKYDYLIELNFFKKEYIMLSSLFPEFEKGDGLRQWRPRQLLVREDLFVFEDVVEISYRMPNPSLTMNYEEVTAVVQAMARFHAQTYIYEEKKSLLLNRSYRVLEDYYEYLTEPIKTKIWRDVGRDAAIALIKNYSKYKFDSKVMNGIETRVSELFEKAFHQMAPTDKLRNTIIHRDLWANNIFLKKENGVMHALLVDFQTVLYSSPMLDLSSVLYFNTSSVFREKYSLDIQNVYYEALTQELSLAGVDINRILEKPVMYKAYEDSLLFALTQAALIVPIVALSDVHRRKLFADHQSSEKISVISRKEEFVDIAKEDLIYRNQVIEVLDELVERYIIQ